MAKRFECENCGAVVPFDAATGTMRCEYCGSVKLIEVEAKAIEEHDLFSAPSLTGWDAALKSFKCDSCGASISSAGGFAGRCPFCDSHYVKEFPTDPGIIRPESVIPFRIGGAEARRRFSKWLGKGFFRPSALKRLARLELLRGVYTPFWTYDARTFSSWTAMSGYYYYVTETYTTTVNGKRVTRTRQVRKTRWVPSSGSRSDFYNDVLIVASRGLDYRLVQKIYPFQLGQLVPYRAEYLSGWLTEPYGVDVRQGWEIARRNMISEECSKCGSEVPGDTYSSLSVNTSFSGMTYKHLLLPIWVAAYRYKDKTYNCLVNGQTGEVHGHAPISWLKVAAVVTAIAAAVGAYLYFVGL